MIYIHIFKHIFTKETLYKNLNWGYICLFDYNGLNWSVHRVGLNHAQTFNDLHAGAHAAEYGVRPIEPLGWCQGYEKLASISIGS